MLKLFILLLISFTCNYVMADCPHGTYTIPSDLGSKWNCVALNTTATDFSYAQDYCGFQYNGVLMSVPNAFINYILADIIQALALDQWFQIGVTNTVGGVWRNVDDGQNTTYFNWSGGAPPGSRNVSLCAVIRSQGDWSWTGCNRVHPYICGFSRATSSETG